VENVPRSSVDDKAPGAGRRWHLLAWTGVAALLTATFAAYGQLGLLLQWVTATFC